MELALRYAVTVTSELSNNRSCWKNTWQVTTDLKVGLYRGWLWSFQIFHSFLSFCFFFLCQKCVCKTYLYSEKHLKFSTLVSFHRQHSLFQYLNQVSATLLIVSAFLVKLRVVQQNLPFPTQHWALQRFSHEDSPETVFSLYSLLKVCTVTTLLLWEGASLPVTLPSPTPLGVVVGNLKFFSLWENTLNFDHILWLCHTC